MCSNTLHYLHRADEPVKTILIGGFLSYFGVFFILPTFFVMGYFMRVLREAGHNEPLSGFEKWKELFIDGSKAYIIWAIYLCIPLLNLLLQGEFVSGM